LFERTVLDGDLAGRLIDLDDLTVGQRRLRERCAPSSCFADDVRA
jgi:hypothetical protein